MNTAKTLLIGASDKPHRFSYKAFHLLHKHDYVVIPMHPKINTLDNCPVSHSFSDINEPIDTITLYVSAEKSAPMQDDILAVAPRRVIFNPGAENQPLCRYSAIKVSCALKRVP